MSNNEIAISIHTSLLPDGSWVYGYAVYWKNGRISTLRTSAEKAQPYRYDRAISAARLRPAIKN